MPSHSVQIQLSITAQEYEAYYRGQVKFVQGVATDGRTVRFPAAILRPYLDHLGIKGLFRIFFDETGKMQKIERISK